MSQPFYKVNLGKAEAQQQFVNLQKVAQKAVEVCGLNGQKAKVALVTDYSPSMDGMFRNGTVQAIIDKLLALGVRFDDNGAIDMFLLNHSVVDIGELSKDDFYGYADNLYRRYGTDGGTAYAPSIQAVIDKYASTGILPASAKNVLNSILGGIGKIFGFNKKQDGSTAIETVEEPAYVMIVTDGENQDREKAMRLLEATKDLPIFFQFVGIGFGFNFLQQASKLDNVGFFSMNDFLKMSEDELYQKMLYKFPQWLKNARAKGIVK